MDRRTPADAAAQLVLAAGTAHDPRAFWTSATELVKETLAADRVVVEYADGTAAGIVDTGQGPWPTGPFECRWESTRRRHAVLRVARGSGEDAEDPDAHAADLRRALGVAGELATLVGRRTLLEHERRLGAFLVELSRWLLTTSIEPHQLLEYTLRSAMTLSGADGAVVAERLPDDSLVVTAAVGSGEVFRHAGSALHTTIFGRVAASGQSLHTKRLGDEEDLDLAPNARARLRAAVFVPLRASGDVMGVLATLRSAGGPMGDDPFLMQDVTYLEAIAFHIAGALEIARAVAAARHAARRASAMVTASPIPLALVSPHGHIVQVNRAWGLLFGQPAEEPPPATLEDHPLTFRDATPSEVLRLAGTGMPWRGRAEAVRNADIRYCEVIATLVDGAEPEFLIAIQDRTEEFRSHRESVAREKLATVGAIAAGVAHEVNNPLAAIRIEAELIGLEASDPEVNRSVKVIVSEVDRAARIAQSLLRLARRSSGAMERVNIRRLLDDVVQVRSAELAVSGITLRVEGSDALPAVYARSGDLEQVFLQIMTNAEQAVVGREDATIEARVEETADGIRLSVDDSGPGVDPSIRARIFDPFFTTRDPDVGTGLGLALSNRVVTELGGRIWVEDSPLGGARFMIELPVAPL